MTEPTKVAFLGLGTMGAAMSANLARAGFDVTGWNRTPGRGAELAELGVTLAATPAEAVRDVEIAVVCVSDTPDVEAVLFGRDGVVDGAREGTLIIDCSTIAPSGSWDFAARLRGAGDRDGRCACVGRQRGRPEGDADDLRRGRCR